MRNRRLGTLMLAAALVVMPVAVMTASPATAARLVFDPWNHSKNLLTAARSLEQIRNQITSLQNEAAMLINQARHLASLPQSSLAQLQEAFSQTQDLMREAQRIAYNVQAIEAAFKATYRGDLSGVSDRDLIGAARERWQTSVAGFEDALKTQATVVGNIDNAQRVVSRLVSASQNATGALQAAQAGNQLVALQAQQLADLTALMAAQGRAEALELARQAATQEQAREQLQRFLAPGAGYRSTPVRMFGN
ncbi:MAG: P-type conjugative transfer protein TrbJ [Pseudomonadota bacterium]